MAAVVSPTVLLRVGAFGRQVAARLRASLSEHESLLREVEHGDPAALIGVLDELLRIGGAHALVEAPRLDLLLIVDLADSPPDLLAELVALSSLIAERYGGVFPAHAPPEQRTIALHLLAAVPPLGTSEPARKALAHLRQLEQWQLGRPPHPLLARIWLIPRQTSAGVLAEEDVLSSTVGFLVASVGAGVRLSEPVRARLAHPSPGEGMVGFAAVATLDVPSERLRAYLCLRACYDAVSELVDRVKAAPAGALPGVEAPTALLDAARLDPFTTGEPAQTLRNLAWRQAGGAALAERLEVGPLATAADLRAQHAALYRPALSGGQTTLSDEPLRAALAALDHAESDSVAAVQRAAEHLLDDPLGHTHPLERLPEVEVGLQRLIARQEQALREERSTAEAAAPAATDERSLAALEAATAALPSAAARQQAGLAAGLAIGLLVTLVAIGQTGGAVPTAVGLSATVVTSTAATPPPAAFPWSALMPWGLGLASGLGAGLLAARQVGASALTAVRAALQDRHDALAALRSDATASLPSRRADQRLRQHRIRVRREVIRASTRALERLATVRVALHDTREALARRLDALGVPPQPDASRDDLRKLLGEPTRLHAPLVGPETVRRWVTRGQRIVDGERWSDRVVRHTWPEGGLVRDVPCADVDAVIGVVNAALISVSPGSLFDDPTAAAEATSALTAFGTRAASVLAPGCTPRNAHGDPASGRRSGELFTVAPASAGAALAEPLTRLAVRVEHALWGTLEVPQVLLVRTWEGFTVDEIARGSGIDPRGGR
jgi:hypothetical protein